jgi:hypothetical protein
MMMMMMIIMMLGTLSLPTNAFLIIPPITTTTTITDNRHGLPSILHLASSSSSSSSIDFQSDDTQFGRGDYHLSASLQENDVVVYQTGTWLVDTVEVGDGTPPIIRYAKIETIQLVWTHNCEHGVLRGVEVNIATSTDNPLRRNIVVPTMPLVDVEFGPEQLVARIPVTWEEEQDEGVLQVVLPFEDVDSIFAGVMDE